MARKAAKTSPEADCPECGGMHFPPTGQCPFIKSPCVICGVDTIYGCSDCAIDEKGSVHVCDKSECRDEHEQATHKCEEVRQ